jgi:hypothetical protein
VRRLQKVTGGSIHRNADPIAPAPGELRGGEVRALERMPFGFRLGESGELVPHEAEQVAIREIVALRVQGNPLRAIAAAAQARGHRISHEAWRAF